MIFFKFIILSVFLFSCSSKSNISPVSAIKDVPYDGHYKIGKPYIIEDIEYKPKKDDNYSEIGTASWYGGEDKFHGKKTANGDLYNKKALTAAHRTLPLPSIVKVTNLKNNRSVTLMVNDRGPFSKKRVIDVSERAAEILGMKHQGSAKVKVEYLKDKTKELLNHISLTEIEGKRVDKKRGKSPHSFLEAHNNQHKNTVSTLNARSLIDEELLNNKILTALNDKIIKKKYYVQVGSYKSKNNATKVTRELKKFGKSHIKSLGQLYQVTFGPYKNNEAKPLIEHLVQIGNNSMKIISGK